MASLTDSEIRRILRSHGEECGPVTAQTRSVYLNRIKKLQSVRPTPEINIIKMRPPIPSIEDSFERDLDRMENDCRRKQMDGKFVSPISYASKSRIEPCVSTNVSNSGSNWYKGSLRTITTYLGPKKHSNGDLLDISDADLSDTETTLFKRLRKNYFKRSPNINKSVPTENVKSQSSMDFSHLPNILLMGFIVVVVAVFGTYLALRTRYSHVELDMALEGLRCKDGAEIVGCYNMQEMVVLKGRLRRLYGLLSEYEGDRVCGRGGEERLSVYNAKERLKVVEKREGIMESEKSWGRLLGLVVAVPEERLGVRAWDNKGNVVERNCHQEKVTYLASLRPRLPLMCRLNLQFVAFLNLLSSILLGALILACLVIVLYSVYLYRQRRARILAARVRDIEEVVAAIARVLQDQHDTPVPLDNLRLMLQHSFPRLRERGYWDGVREHAFRHEPSILVRDTVNMGTTLQWRGATPGWQGTPLRGGEEVAFERGPTECLKIRNIAIDKYGADWEEGLRHELLARVGADLAREVRHTGFIVKGASILAYLLCSSREAAGAAFARLNAHYFNGALLHVKFIRRDKYLRRFPYAPAAPGDSRR